MAQSSEDLRLYKEVTTTKKYSKDENSGSSEFCAGTTTIEKKRWGDQNQWPSKSRKVVLPGRTEGPHRL
jgi:hypothetical protein